jgi:formate dehydrogenase iron-sulfur subunit
MEPACAKACPTDSIRYGKVSELRDLARERVASLHERGHTDAYLYGAEPNGEYGPLNAFFLLTDRPSVYNLPEAPRRPAAHMKANYAVGFGMAAALAAAVAFVFRGGGER